MRAPVPLDAEFRGMALEPPRFTRAVRKLINADEQAHRLIDDAPTRARGLVIDTATSDYPAYSWFSFDDIAWHSILFVIAGLIAFRFRCYRDDRGDDAKASRVAHEPSPVAIPVEDPGAWRQRRCT